MLSLMVYLDVLLRGIETGCYEVILSCSLVANKNVITRVELECSFNFLLLISP